MQWFLDRTAELMHAAGAARVWSTPVAPTTAVFTCSARADGERSA